MGLRAVVALVGSLVAGTFLFAGSESFAATGGIPRCHTGDLRASLGRFGVGLGNATTEVSLRNRSDHQCFVYGYPGIGLEDSRHHEQRSRLTWSVTYFQLDPRPHLIVLSPGRRAYSNLAWSENPGPGENVRGPCEPVSVWLEVTPPDEREHLLARFGQHICAHGRLFATALSSKPRM